MKINVNVEKILFENTEDGFTVMLVSDNLSKKFLQFKAVANTVGIKPNMTLLLVGDWENSPKYGQTFKVQRWEEELPGSPYGIERYLGSGIIKGIGPTLAEAIVGKFGIKTFDIINTHSTELLEVSKIGEKKAQQIWESWDEHNAMRESVSYLLDVGLSVTMAIKIFNKYKEETISQIKENPYNLIYDIDGIGFIRADEIARKMGFDLKSPNRIKAAIFYILSQYAEDGNTYMPDNELLNRATKLLEIKYTDIEPLINKMIENGILQKEENRVYLAIYYYAEKNIAYHLKRMASTFSSLAMFQPNVEKIEEELGIKYEPEQIDAIRTALNSNVMILTGGPGTGKTTVTRGIIRALQDEGFKIACAAPTGKAAERMEEATGMESKTIHRLLCFNPKQGPMFDETKPLPFDVLIIDESSMINVKLMDTFLSAVPYSAKLILIGDVDQLPSIGAGNVLKDIIGSNEIPVVRLEKIFRQAQSSRIIINAHQINHGVMPNFSNKDSNDFFFIPSTDNEEVSNKVIELVTKRLPKAYGVPAKDIQVLTPMKVGDLGTVILNNNLQSIINPVGKSIKYGLTTFRVGDKVMQIKNNYDKDVFNGDTGTIVDIDENCKIIVVQFKNNQVFYDQKDFEQLILAYASTIHKSQGSEYDIVVIPITKAHYVMLQRNLIYTAITRAKKICVLVGDISMIKYCISHVVVDNRLTTLKKRLQESLAR